MVGCRHFEVAKMLKGIPKGTTFVLRVVEPLKAGFGKKSSFIMIRIFFIIYSHAKYIFLLLSN